DAVSRARDQFEKALHGKYAKMLKDYRKKIESRVKNTAKAMEKREKELLKKSGLGAVIEKKPVARKPAAKPKAEAKPAAPAKKAAAKPAAAKKPAAKAEKSAKPAAKKAPAKR